MQTVMGVVTPLGALLAIVTAAAGNWKAPICLKDCLLSLGIPPRLMRLK